MLIMKRVIFGALVIVTKFEDFVLDGSQKRRYIMGVKILREHFVNVEMLWCSVSVTNGQVLLVVPAQRQSTFMREVLL